MRKAVAILHEQSFGMQVATMDEPTRVEMAPRIGLAWLDRLGANLLLDEDAPPELREWLVDAATALGGEDANGARKRLLARSLASARAQVAILEAMIAERVAARDAEGLALVDRALTNASRRLVALLAEHRHTHAPERPIVVAVERAEVTVAGAR